MVDNGGTALYTGLEIGQNSQGNVLYAADFGQNQVEMFDGSFKPIGSPFSDPSVKSFADGSFRTWSVQAVNDKLYLTFASLKDFSGGVVDVFNTDGLLLTPSHFAANAPGAGPLDNPWGITQAPANFGAYSNDLLIGNVAGHGNINVFDPTTYAYLGQLRQPDGAPIAITGLWDLEFGDGTPDSGKTNQLFFDAGPNAPGVSINGLFGVIRAVGDQGGNGGGDLVREAAAQVAQLRQAPVSAQALPASYLGEESDPGGSGLSNALPTGVLGQGSGAVLGGVQAQPATSPSPAPAAGSSQAVPLASTPPGPALGVTAYRVRHQAFADLEGTLSVALAPAAEPPWAW
jgi:hypothetical protein